MKSHFETKAVLPGKGTKPAPVAIEKGDRTLLLILCSLMILGLAMIYSTSSALAWETHADATYFFARQIFWTFLGVGIFVFMAQTDYHKLQDWIIPMTGLIFALLIAVPLFGVEVNGARRWLRIGSVSFQPSEIAKLFAVIYLSHYIAKKGEHLAEFFRGLSPVLLILCLLCFLIFIEPDLGTTLTIVILTVLLLFIGGASRRHLIGLTVCTIAFASLALMRYPYMLQRVKTYINPLRDPPAKSFQINQSYIALGSGGPFGVGLGEGRQKLFFLPQPHTDFIFSVVGEEFGLLGTFAVIFLFTCLLWKGAQIASKIEDPFGQMLAIGTTLLMVMPALMNMGVVTGLLPTKGLSLPFLSYGGSSLLMNWIAAGILYRISREVPTRRSARKDKILQIEGAYS
ncbi:MAG: putative lipid II flippase FtsW [Nitrospirota bacterium]